METPETDIYDGLYDDLDSLVKDVSTPPVIQELGEWGDDGDVQAALDKHCSSQQFIELLTSDWADDREVDELLYEQSYTPFPVAESTEQCNENKNYEEDRDGKNLHQPADSPPSVQEIEAMDWSDCDEAITVYPFEEKMEVD